MVKYDYEYKIDNKDDNEMKSFIPFFSNISFIGIHKVEQIKNTLNIYLSIPYSSVTIENNRFNHFSRKLPILSEKVNIFTFHSTNELKIQLIENKHYKSHYSILDINKYVFAIYATDNTYPKWERGDIQEAAKKLISYDSRPKSTHRSRSHERERSHRSRSRERDYDYDNYKKRERERDYEDSRDRKRYRSRSRSRERDHGRNRSRERTSNVPAQEAQHGFKVPPMVPFSYGVPYEQYGYYGVPHGYPVPHVQPGFHVPHGQPGYPVPHVHHGYHGQHGYPVPHGQHGIPVSPPPPGQNFSYGNM